MQELGKITIDVYKDDSNQYSFSINENNEDLSCIRYVIEDTLKCY